MIVKKHPSTDPVLQKLLNSNSILELMTAGKYDQAAEYLNQAQLAVDQYANPMLSTLLVLARYLCSASKRNHEQMQWHRSAIEDTINGEIELNDRLESLLGLFDRLTDASRSYTPVDLPPHKNTVYASPDNGPTTIQNNARRRGLRGFLIRDASPTSDPNPIRFADSLAVDEPLVTGNIPQTPHSLTVYGLGTFQVYRNDELIETWSNRKGVLVLKYLLMNRERQVHKEMLMDLFWPDSEEEAQRNNLNVVIYGLRQALRNGDPSFSHVLFQNDCYFLNPDLSIWVDYEAFQEHFKNGQRHEQAGNESAMLREYTAAETLYQGSLLPEDCYEGWIDVLRANLEASYLSILHSLSLYYLQSCNYSACINICHKMLEMDSCREEAHIRLMCCYSRQGQPYLALRQYDRCVKALASELDIAPMPETTALYTRIRSGQPV